MRPLFRYYDQSEADFYAVQFDGAPEFYSSDYRISALTSLGYGLKLIYAPNSRVQFDAESPVNGAAAAKFDALTLTRIAIPGTLIAVR